MPYRRRRLPMKKRPMRRRRYGRRRYGRRKRSLGLGVNKMMGFPNSRLVKMRYCTHVNLDPGAGTLATYTFRANSVYDPDFSGVGHQAIGFDQWSLFYGEFVVIGSKISVLYNKVGNDGVNQIVGISLNNDSTTIGTDYTTMIERGQCKWKLMQPTNNGQNDHKIRKGFSAKKWFNIKDIKDNTPRIGHDASGNPVQSAFFTVFANALDQASDPSVANYLVTIDYLVLCSNPLQIAQS